MSATERWETTTRSIARVIKDFFELFLDDPARDPACVVRHLDEDFHEALMRLEISSCLHPELRRRNSKQIYSLSVKGSRAISLVGQEWVRYALDISLFGGKRHAWMNNWRPSYFGTNERNVADILTFGYSEYAKPNPVNGEGTYSSPDLRVAQTYALPFRVGYSEFQAVLENRVNPHLTIDLPVRPPRHEKQLIHTRRTGIRPCAILIRRTYCHQQQVGRYLYTPASEDDSSELSLEVPDDYFGRLEDRSSSVPSEDEYSEDFDDEVGFDEEDDFYDNDGSIDDDDYLHNYDMYPHFYF